MKTEQGSIELRGKTYTATMTDFDSYDTEVGQINLRGVIYKAIKQVGVLGPGPGPGPVQVAGLYDENDNLIVTYEDSGMDVAVEYTGATYQTDSRSGYSTMLRYPEAKKVILPDTVTTIGNYAVYGCSALTSINIGNGVTSIGGYSFTKCTNLTTIVIGSSLNSIKANAFTSDTKLVDVYISDLSAWCNVTGLGYLMQIGQNKKLYLNDELITDFTVPGNIATVAPYAFYRCTDIASLIISEGVSNIGAYAFGNCGTITDVTLPRSLKTLGSMAFQADTISNIYISDLFDYCNITRSSPIPGGNKTLYLNGEQVTKLAIPEGITSISNYAFYGYTKLTSITIPEGVTSIGESAFSGCSNVTSLTLPSTLTTIAYGAFISVKLNSLYINDLSAYCRLSTPNRWFVRSSYIQLYLNNTLVTDLVIPSDVTNIGAYAFRYVSFNTVTISEAVTSIGDYAFNNVSYVHTVTFKGTPGSISRYALGSSAIRNIYVPWSEGEVANAPWSATEATIHYNSQV